MKPTAPPPAIPRRYQRYAVGFLAAVGVLAVVVLLASLARVRIVITPRPAPLAADIEVAVVGSGSARTGEVRGRLVRAEGTALVRPGGAPPPATPATAEAPTRARGTVTLVNTHGAAQPLVATTRLLSADGVLFRIEKGVTIPAKGKLDGVAVYADQPGAHGNISPAKFTIPGLSAWLQQRVWAESTEAMSGGFGAAPVATVARSPVAAAPAAIDVAALRTRAQAMAREDAMQRALAMKKSGLREELVTLDESARVDVTGAEARGTVTISALLVDWEALEAAARAALEAKAKAAGQTFRRLKPGALTWRVARADGAAARATLLVHAEGETAVAREFRSFDPHRLAGFTAEDVATYLKSIPGVEEVEVTFWPAWVRRVPASTGVVRVEVREPKR